MLSELATKHNMWSCITVACGEQLYICSTVEVMDCRILISKIARL